MWIPFTADQIQNSLSTTERLAMTAVDSAACLQDVVQSVIALIIGKVNTWAANQGNLGPTGTIPDETLGAAIAIGRYKFLTSLPGTNLITKWREADRDEGYGLLDQISTGKMLIVGANGAIGNLPATASPTFPGEPGDPYFPPYLVPNTVPDPVWSGGYW